MIGAISLDQGPSSTRDIILRLFANELHQVTSQGAAADYKSQLQVFIQAREQSAPVYRVVSATGPDHKKQFTVEVITGDTVLGKGTGKSKNTAEAEAARAALQQLKSGFTQ